MMEKYYAVTRWTVEDIQEYRPDWSEEQCVAWWEKHERAFHEMMTAEGMERLAIMLDETAPAEGVEA